ncbi:hypothetical protein [Flavobacterium wongokense]|uniref:hypothetical protein n=1 Tax=Flavobacterium wongokense TaxID=2910674 RepID=UPI001F18AB73|nr:hypothetical protein [Flavobacterium sp. WG47]MCF6131302.1 hypothetical protein [Flavobacterium sp. WG47]
MKKIIFIIYIFFPWYLFPQSNLETAIKGGELLLSGLSILKVAKSDSKPKSKVIESVCVKNKLNEKITFRIMGENKDGDDIKKELVIPKDGKECLFVLPKGIYTYEIVLPNKEIYKKGEYKFEEDVVITVKEE